MYRDRTVNKVQKPSNSEYYRQKPLRSTCQTLPLEDWNIHPRYQRHFNGASSSLQRDTDISHPKVNVKAIKLTIPGTQQNTLGAKLAIKGLYNKRALTTITWKTVLIISMLR
jgi:hypothetical protein